MKRLIFILLYSTLFAIKGFGQRYEPFISETKQWKYVQTVYLLGNSSGAVYLVENDFFKGDTTINSLKYHKFYKKQNQPIPSEEYIGYFFREDTISKQVYVYDPSFNKTALFYDFNLKKGDTFNIYLINDLFLKQTVLKIDTFITLDKHLKRIIFDDSTIWIEGIGNMTRTSIPSEGELICMKENDSVLYINKNYNNCDTIFQEDTSTSIKQIINYRLSVFPNPIEKSSILTIEPNKNEKFIIEIYNYLGIQIKEDSFFNDYHIGLINLNKGIYIYRIINRNKIIGIDKVIVK